ncbi:2-oxo-tetronate isomerase [Desulfovibrio sp. SGI.169]|uniref:2-oxo-tetronate isomerase n=1 Tax=Desulfovibrio sp. SGI.169 TaxID=3420561 RepID=UPI003CFC4896
MPRFAANLTMMFTELPFLDRFSAAADQGFQWVEYLFPYEFAPEHLARALERNRLRQALFNLPPGDWAAGERGMACLPDREKDMDAALERALTYAAALHCPRVHLMAGNRPPGVDAARLEQTYLGNVRRAAQRLADAGLELCLEPINHYSMPEYFLRTQEQAAAYIERLNLPNLRLQFDFFHCQMEQGNVSGRLRRFFPLIGHCQLAGAPNRHEPDQGELNYPHLLALLDELGYQGVVGCEYNPAGRTEDGLGWIRPWGVLPGRCRAS